MTGAKSAVQTQLFSDTDQEAMIAKFVREVFRQGVGQDIPSARKTTMEQYLKNSLRIFSKAFNKDNVQGGFRAVHSHHSCTISIFRVSQRCRLAGIIHTIRGKSWQSGLDGLS